MSQKESELKKDIMTYLRAMPKTYSRVLQIAGFRGRSNQSKGMADIICVSRGWAIAIECKTDKGVLSEQQKEFLTGWQEAGGISIIARSLEDVISGIREATGWKGESGKAT